MGSFQDRVHSGKILPLIGVYDVFSARIAASQFEGIFCSGFSYAASHYGLPDIGYLTWKDTFDFASRIRLVLPKTHLLVDIDDGFGDSTIAGTVMSHLSQIGVSAVMFEDQKRPRRCGHYAGKEILETSEYLNKLQAVIANKKNVFVIARTDSTHPTDAIDRAIQYCEAGADGVMVEAISNLQALKELRKKVNKPIMVNQINGGKSPNWTLDELSDAGANIVIYSTPCLFSAQFAMENYLRNLKQQGKLPSENTSVISACTEVLVANNHDVLVNELQVDVSSSSISF